MERLFWKRVSLHEFSKKTSFSIIISLGRRMENKKLNK